MVSVFCDCFFLPSFHSFRSFIPEILESGQKSGGRPEATWHFILFQAAGTNSGIIGNRSIASDDWLFNKGHYSRAPLVMHKHQNKASLEFIHHFTHEMSFLV